MNRLALIVTLVIACMWSWPGVASVESDNVETEDILGWRDRSIGLLDLDLVSLDIDPYGRKILIASQSAVYLSDDTGDTWKRVFRFEHPGSDSIDTDENQELFQEDDETDFDPSDYDYEELVDAGVLDEGEDIDDVDDEELKRRLQDAGIIERSESSEFFLEDAAEDDAVTMLGVHGKIHRVIWDPIDSSIAYIASDKGVYLTTDSGVNWNPLAFNDNVDDVIPLSSPGHLLILSNNRLFLSNDFGKNSTILTLDLKNSKILDMELEKGRKRVVLTTADTDVFTLNVQGQMVSYGTVVKSGEVNSIQAAGSDTAELYVTTRNRVFALSPEGAWLQIPKLSLSGSAIFDMNVSSTHLGIATDRGIYVWDLEDRTGRFVHEGLLDLNIRDIAVNPSKPDQMWIATASGLYCLERGFVQQEPGQINVLPASFPTIDLLISAAINYAEIDFTRTANTVKAVKQISRYPLIELIFRYADINWEGYAYSDVTSIYDGIPAIGPIDEVYVNIDRNYWDAAIGLRWYPQESVFLKERLKVRDRYGKEMSRRNEVIADVSGKYVNLIAEYRMYNGSGSMRKKLSSKLRIQQLLAEMDALTGFRFEYFNKKL